MWRNFGWTAILAIWTIFLILNSGLAGERISNNPRINNAHTSREAAVPVLDKQFVDDSRPRYAKETSEASHRLLTHRQAVFPELKNTETLNFNGPEKRITMSNAIAAPLGCSRNCDDGNAHRLVAAEGAATGENNVWLSKIVILEKSRKTRYREFPSNLRVSSPASRGLKGASRRRKHKEGTTYMFSNGRKEATAIGRDTRAFDETAEWRKGRIFSEGNRAAAFFRGKFSKRLQRGSSTTTREKPVVPELQTPEDIESERTGEIRRSNNESRTNSRRGGLEITKNNADGPSHMEGNGDSRSTAVTFPNHSSSKENVRSTTDAVTDDTVARSSSHENSAASIASRITSIFNSGSPNVHGEVHGGENPFSRYHFPKDEYSRSYKAVAGSPAVGTHEERSKVGFKVNTSVREGRKWNEDIGDSFTFRASSSPDGYLNRNRIGFTERPPPPRKKAASALRTVLDIAGSRREYHSSLHNVGAITDDRATDPALGLQSRRKTGLAKGIAGDVNYTSHNARPMDEPLPINSAGDRIDQSKVEPSTSPRISVTQQWHPVHVRHVKSSGKACKRQRPAGGETEVPIDSWNVSRGRSGISKFESPSEQKVRRYLRKLGALDTGASRTSSTRVVVETAAATSGAGLDEQQWAQETSVGSISPDAMIISDNSTETWKINGRALSSRSLSSDESMGEPDGKNAKVVMKNPSENENDARKEPGIRSRGDDARDSSYRRYKRHEVRLSTWESLTLTKLETRRALGAPTTVRTTGPSLEFTAGPSISTTPMNDAGPVSIAAEESTATTIGGTPTFPKYHEFQAQRRSITPMGTDYKRYTSVSPAKMGSDSLETPFTSPADTSNVDAAETPALLIRTPDRSIAVTKIDNSVIRKEAAAEAPASNENVSDAPSIEPISSPEGRAKSVNGSAVTIIDPFPQKSSDPTQDVFGNVTAENVDESSAGIALLDQWPVKHSAVVEGDLVLGGLMMVHEREDTITCGPVMPQGGVQALEAMLYTLDTLNDREIVPGVKIGAHILDDCDKDTYGLEMAVDFIKGSISNIDGAEYHCNKTAVRKIISGVVGAASSVTSIQVANLLRLFRIPQVSFFSTSPELSNKQRFEYFTRTIPSDHYQVKAMVDIVLKMGWSYVSIIYEESNYGIKAFEELEELLGKHNICIAIKEKLVKDSGVAEEIAYDNIVSKLLTKPRARGCIIFGSDQEVAGVMRAVRRCNATGAFSWIGSDGWSARGLVSNGNEPEVEGTLSVQPQANPVKGFEEYFLNLTVENNRRNPWFVEFWEDHFKCRYPNSSRTPYNKKYTKICTTKERLTKQNTAFEDQLQFVSDAVMAFAYAFRDMHHDLCHGRSGLCDAMKPTNGTKLLQYLRKVDFEGLSGDEFRFDKNGDGPARYNIIHFKQTEPGKYKWVRVGKYLEGELRLNMSEIQFKLGHPQPPESVCSLPCEVGQAKKYVEGERCCWHCFNCTQYQIRHPKDETRCIQCRQGTVPDETHSTCRDIPEEFLRPESGWAIGAMCFSAFGIFVTLFVCGVFLRHNDTPVVRASGRELSYVLLVGILLCYLVTFTLVLRPTNAVCGIQRVAAGLCFTVVYAALLTKTNRIARIFNDGRQSAKRPSFISPRSQLIICFGLVSVQILINVVWILIDPARAMHHYPTMEDNLLVCNSYIDASYMIAFAYPIILIAVCTVYAVLTRKIPEAFNESKHIGFAMYTTCVIWLAFVPLYFGTGNNVALRITSMSVTISLSASVMVVCLFSPKLYIILIRPERNVRPNIKAGRPNLTKSSAITATNPSSMMGPVTATAVLTAATCDQNKAIKKHIASTIDCSTQSEYYEMEMKEQKNGKPLATCASRSTQTINNEKDLSTTTTTTAITTSSLTTTTITAGNKESPDVVASAGNKEPKNNTTTTKRLNNNARIGNGPLSQSEVSL